MSDNISNKLEYLDGTKSAIKNAIINKGQTVSEYDTFRSYANAILNITSGIDTSDATATVSDIVEGKTAYVNGSKITGNIKNFSSPVSASSRLNNSSQYLEFYKTDSSYSRVIPKSTQYVMRNSFSSIRSLIGLTNNILKDGVTVLGITGNYAGPDERSIYEFNSVASMASYLNNHQLAEGVKADVYNISEAGGGFNIGDEFTPDDFDVTKVVNLTAEDMNNYPNIDFLATCYAGGSAQPNMYIALRPGSIFGSLNLAINPNGVQEYAYSFTADVYSPNPTFTLSDNDYTSFMNKLEEMNAEAQRYGIELKFVVERFNSQYSGDPTQSLIDTVNKFIHRAGSGSSSEPITGGTVVNSDNLVFNKIWTMTEQDYNSLISTQPMIALENSTQTKSISITTQYSGGSLTVVVTIYSGGSSQTYTYYLSMDSLVMNDTDYNYMIQAVHSVLDGTEFTSSSQYTHNADLLVPLVYKAGSGGSSTETFGYYITKLNNSSNTMEWVERDFMSKVTNIDGLTFINPFGTLEPRKYYSNGLYGDGYANNYNAVGMMKPVSLVYNNSSHEIETSIYWKDLDNRNSFPFSNMILLFNTYDPIQGIPNDSLPVQISNVLGTFVTNQWSPVLSIIGSSAANYSILQNVKDIVFSNN